MSFAMQCSPSRASSGFTLVEIAAIVVIVTVLATLVFHVSKRLPTMADQATCASKMRNLHGALAAYTIENDHWPQQPPFGRGEEAEMDQWWLRTLAPYGMDHESAWQCPGIKRIGSVRETGTGDEPFIHYMPSLFDPRPTTPFRWQWQPWAVEIADVHGRGAHMLFPDGSIRTQADLFGWSDE